MKKAAITISAIAIACLASALALTGCASAEDFTAMSYTSGGSVTDIVINVSERALDIIASEDENVHIAYHDSEKEYLDIRKNDDGRLTIELAENKEWTDHIGFAAPAEYRRIEVRVPAGVASLSAVTSGEDVTISGLKLSDSLGLNVNNGDISFESCDVGRSIGLTVKNGDISGSIAGSAEDFSITCDVKKGDTDLPERTEGGEKTLTISVNNGDAHISFV